MDFLVEVDQKQRIQIPANMLNSIHSRPGDTVKISCANGSIAVREWSTLDRRWKEINMVCKSFKELTKQDCAVSNRHKWLCNTIEEDDGSEDYACTGCVFDYLDFDDDKALYDLYDCVYECMDLLKEGSDSDRISFPIMDRGRCVGCFCFEKVHSSNPERVKQVQICAQMAVRVIENLISVQGI